MRARTLYLHGKLGKELGRKHKIYVDSVAEAMRYLAANFGEKFYANIKEGYYRLKKVSAKTVSFIDEQGLSVNLGEGDLYVIPVTKGAAGTRQKQVGMIVAGIALAAVTFGVGAVVSGVGLTAAFTTTAGAGAAVAATGAIGTAAFSMSAALVLQGIAGLLTPLPKVKQQGEVAQNASSSSGILNTFKEGSTIPVIYGKVKVGSVVISSGVYAEQMATDSQYSVVMNYLKEYISKLNTLLAAYNTAINITGDFPDVVTNNGGYSYYPGKYPYIKSDLQSLYTKFYALLQQAQRLQGQEVTTLSLDAYEQLVDATIQLTSGATGMPGALSIIEGMYETVGEVCDFYVSDNPYRTDKAATAISTGVIVTSPQVTSPQMRHYRDEDNVVTFTYTTYLGYYATTKANNTFRNAETFTPLDQCYYMTNVFNYVLKGLKEKEDW